MTGRRAKLRLGAERLALAARFVGLRERAAGKPSIAARVAILGRGGAMLLATGIEEREPALPHRAGRTARRLFIEPLRGERALIERLVSDRRPLRSAGDERQQGRAETGEVEEEVHTLPNDALEQ